MKSVTVDNITYMNYNNAFDWFTYSRNVRNVRTYRSFYVSSVRITTQCKNNVAHVKKSSVLLP